MGKLRFPIGVLDSEDMRKIRVVSDIELCRRNPGWFCAMFHYGRLLVDSNRWLLIYSVQMTNDTDPQLREILIGRVKMADGSQVWASVEWGSVGQ